MELSERKKEWFEWHQKNPKIYELFERFTFEAIKAGHTKLSAWLIVNRIRWETSIATNGTDHKISNDHIAFYSRHFIENNPQYSGFFVMKKMKGA